MDHEGTHDLAQGLAQGLARLARAEDPRTAAKLATQLLDEVGRIQLAVSQLRDLAVLDLHEQGNSLHDIGRLTHLTRGRVFQIVKRGREALASDGSPPLDPGPTWSSPTP